MQKLGMEVPKNEIKSIIKRHDLTKDGMISFPEFKTIFAVEGVGCLNKPFGSDGPKLI